LTKARSLSRTRSSELTSGQANNTSSIRAFLEETRLLLIGKGPRVVFWDSVHLKEYPRLPHIKLIAPMPHLDVSLPAAIERRRSATAGFSRANLSPVELSTLLRWSCGMRSGGGISDFRRVYPSAGARYPLEVYPIVLRCSGIPPGLYHYAPTKHSLVCLLGKDLTQLLVSATSDERIVSAGLVIVLTGVFGRTTEKYGARGLRYVLIEVGHVAQNLALVATALGLASYSIGGFVDEEIDGLLDTQNELEDPLCLFAVGKPPRYNVRS